RVPLLSPSGCAACCELREDPRHFFAVRQLDGLQVVEQRPQLGSASRSAVRKLVDQVQKGQLIRIVQRAIRGKIADELIHASFVPGGLGQVAAKVPKRALFAPEKYLSGRNATGACGLVESASAVHQDDNLAIVVDDAVQRRLQGLILAAAAAPEEDKQGRDGK